MCFTEIEKFFICIEYFMGKKLKKSRKKVQEIIKKYYSDNSKAYKILTLHSECVAELALEIEERHPELELDKVFLYESAMLHDIGAFACNAPGIGCMGKEPYIKHGVIGSEILTLEGLPLHALVCERHTGVGLSLEAIKRRNLPLPHRDMLPISMEEKIVCFADCFYSKSGDPSKRKTVDQIIRGLTKHGADQVEKFKEWCDFFL